jgi:hypothetical protein
VLRLFNLTYLSYFWFVCRETSLVVISPIVLPPVGKIAQMGE